MSAAAVFAEIVAAGWAGVSDWPKQNKEETLHLEFKRQSDIKTPYNDKDRGSLAKSIAGFANVEGGVVVFGVHAKDMGKKPDMVQSICAFDDIAEVGSRIDRDLPNLTDPPVPGLRIEKITDPANPDSGVIAIFVPASDGGPHRATKGGSDVVDRYYMRTASQTVNMPHSILSALFGRRPPPVLKLLCRLKLGETQSECVIQVSNQGRGHAESLALRLDQGLATAGMRDRIAWNKTPCSAFRGWHIAPFNGELGKGPSILARSDYGLVLSPGMQLDVVVVQLERSLNHETDAVVIRGELYAKNSMPVVFYKEILIRDVDTNSTIVEIN